MSSSSPDVGGDGQRADRRGLTLAGLLLEVRQHDVRALLREPRAQREADTAGAAGHDAHLVLDVHGRSFRFSMLVGHSRPLDVIVTLVAVDRREADIRLPTLSPDEG